MPHVFEKLSESLILRERKVSVFRVFLVVFSRIRTEYGEIISVFSPNAEKYGPENSEYGYFSRSVSAQSFLIFLNFENNRFFL